MLNLITEIIKAIGSIFSQRDKEVPMEPIKFNGSPLSRELAKRRIKRKYQEDNDGN